MKQTAIEWLFLMLNNPNLDQEFNNKLFEKAKEMEKQQSYSEEEVLAFGKSCFYKGFDKAENDDANCYTAFREEIGGLFEQFKNK